MKDTAPQHKASDAASVCSTLHTDFHGAGPVSGGVGWLLVCGGERSVPNHPLRGSAATNKL